ncbi:hypothetical protein PUV54_06815 [Hyphococcus flavus]|uniref:Uncharacterized protein n=1 Tax=Hyphococcus flavus TaxID=1866326 RepID=A0AAF0CH12_9PROT|nr:hypothetical protein [Hyphococcus flavus]WDI32908.1 hypothetical protein PUV54_06815 [Hyphococcus flavus]
MNAETLYRMVQQLWPERVDISDATISGSSRARFPKLSYAWDKAELAVEPVGVNYKRIQDSWRDLGVWCYFQAFHQCAHDNYMLGRREVQRSDVSLNDFKARMKAALAVEGWERERVLYEAANGQS